MLAALAIWSMTALVIVLRHASYAHLTSTGVDGPIPSDQLQYLAWIRQAGDHVLAANVWDLASYHHVFLQPMWLLSGLAWRLGVSLPVAYLLWKPVAVLALFGGVLAYARRLLPGTRARLAAVVLALFFYIPVGRALTLTHLGSPPKSGEAAGEMFAAGQLWGYLPNALALGLMPVFLLAVERALAARASAESPGSTRRYLAIAAAAGALVSWLHPWQGETLVLIALGWAAWERSPGRIRILAVPVLATLAPLAYYFALSRLDAAWKIGVHVTSGGRFQLWILAVGVAPLAIPAAFAVRGRGRGGGAGGGGGRGFQERVLLLWPLASLAGYFATPSVPAHALQGVSIPLAVLAVRGWGRLRAPALLGAAAVALATVPGTVYVVDQFRKLVSSDGQPFLLQSAERQALDYTAASARAGGVLAPLFIGLDVPPRTGRSVWVGHQSWTPHWLDRVRQTEQLFDGQLTAAAARTLVRSTGATVLVSDCQRRTDLARTLGPLLGRVTRFGCAAVYELR